MPFPGIYRFITKKTPLKAKFRRVSDKNGFLWLLCCCCLKNDCLLPHKHQLLIKNAKKPLLDLSFANTKDAVSGNRFSPVT
jgi:hypothetical protein